ncbi:MAG: hypothetical protein NXI32_22205 [bacterium]|nr:hypothetical protein [bacterium]
MSIKVGDYVVISGSKLLDWDDPNQQMLGAPAMVVGVAAPYLAIQYANVLEPHLRSIDMNKWYVGKCSAEYFAVWRHMALQHQAAPAAPTPPPQQAESQPSDDEYPCPECKLGVFRLNTDCHCGEDHWICDECGAVVTALSDQ